MVAGRCALIPSTTSRKPCSIHGRGGILAFSKNLAGCMWTVDQRDTDVSGARPAWLLRECGRREQVNGPAKEALQGQMGTVEVGGVKKDLMKSELHWVTGSQG